MLMLIQFDTYGGHFLIVKVFTKVHIFYFIALILCSLTKSIPLKKKEPILSEQVQKTVGLIIVTS